MLHPVREGETLASIAESWRSSPAAFLAANPHRVFDGAADVVAGEALWLPTHARLRDVAARSMDSSDVAGDLGAAPSNAAALVAQARSMMAIANDFWNAFANNRAATAGGDSWCNGYAWAQAGNVMGAWSLAAQAAGLVATFGGAVTGYVQQMHAWLADLDQMPLEQDSCSSNSGQCQPCIGVGYANDAGKIVALAQQAVDAAAAMVPQPPPQPPKVPRIGVRLPWDASPAPASLLAGTSGDFQSDIGNTAFSGAWNEVQAQLTSEGVSSGSADMLAAQQQLASAFDSFSSQGLTGGDALSAAKAFVLKGQTLAGAASMVDGLISAAENGAPPAQLLEGFTGTMIGVLVTAGAVSVGVGAAIVAGATFVVELLAKAGLFGSPPQGEVICGNITFSGGSVSYLLPGQVNPAPVANGQTNCIGVIDPYWDPTQHKGIAPGSSRWRHFPIPPPSTDPKAMADAGWFLPTVGFLDGGNFQWQPPNNDKPTTYIIGSGTFLPRSPSMNARPIDAAFPLYHQIECETAAGPAALVAGGVPPAVLGTLQQFQASFFAALKLNWEYALNGLLPTSDDRVLAHTIQVWNRAREPGDGFDLRPTTSAPWTTDGTTCAGIPPLYMAIAVNGIVTNPVSGIMTSDNLGVHINTGAKKSAPFVVGPYAPSSSTSTGTAVAVGVGLFGAALAALWLFLGKPMTLSALKSAWRHA